MVVVCIDSSISLFSTKNILLGAFLIPYFILYFLIGAPIYYLELALGQFSSRGPATAFILARGWQGKFLEKKISRNFFWEYLKSFRCWFCYDYQQCLMYALLQCDHQLGIVLFYCIISNESSLENMWTLVE